MQRHSRHEAENLRNEMEQLEKRIAILRSEETKAKQKVADAKGREQEIVSMQRRHREAQATRKQEKEAEAKLQAEQEAALTARRAEHRAGLRATFEALHSARREDAQTERRIKEENAELLRQARESEAERARKRRDDVRSQHIAVRARFQEQQEKHREILARDFISVIAAEDQRRERVEVEIAAMEAQEREHIARLQELQVDQKAAYEELERALAS